MGNWKIRPSTTQRDKKIISLYNKGYGINDLSRKFQLWHSQISIIVNPKMRLKLNKRQKKYQSKWLKTKPGYLKKRREASNICVTRRYNICPAFRKKNIEYSKKWRLLNA